MIRQSASTMLVSLAFAGAAAAGDGETDRSLRLELNTMTQTESACRLTFVVDNALGADLDALVLETVVFDAGGVVERLSLFDFQSVPEGRTRVRQFDLPGAECAALGRVLVNAAEDCSGAGLEAGACMEHLRLESRADLEVSG